MFLHVHDLILNGMRFCVTIASVAITYFSALRVVKLADLLDSYFFGFVSI